MKLNFEDKIECTRKELIDVALKEGLASKKTMELSQKLDLLINEFESQKENCCR